MLGQVDNGHVEPVFMGHNKGYRQLVISPEGEFRPVVEVIRKRMVMSDGKTFQAYDHGDYIIRHTFDAIPEEGGYKPVNKWEFLIVDQLCDAFRPMTKSELKAAEVVLRDAIALLKTWLSDRETLSTYLPKGVGWDGQCTESEAKHFDRCLDFLKLKSLDLNDKEFNRMIRDIVETPAHMHHLVWKDAKKLPYGISVGRRRGSWGGNGGSYNEWILIYEGGRIQYLKAEVNSHGDATDYDYHVMPGGVKKAIALTRNILKYPAGGRYYGISWVLYQLKDFKVTDTEDAEE